MTESSPPQRSLTSDLREMRELNDEFNVRASDDPRKHGWPPTPIKRSLLNSLRILSAPWLNQLRVLRPDSRRELLRSRSYEAEDMRMRCWREDSPMRRLRQFFQ